MGRDTTGVRGMDVCKDGKVIAMDVARDDQDLLVVTENGYGKRTQMGEYRKTNRGAIGVKTIKLTENKGGLAGALVVREHEDLLFISSGGMVQRTSVRGINRYGRGLTGRTRDEPQGRRSRSARWRWSWIFTRAMETAALRSPRSRTPAEHIPLVAAVRYSAETRERRWS